MSNSMHADLLNALSAMQDIGMYSLRRWELKQAENLIVGQELKITKQEALIRELAAALQPLQERMANMIDAGLCDCEGSHVCGLPHAKREVFAALHALAKAKEALK